MSEQATARDSEIARLERELRRWKARATRAESELIAIAARLEAAYGYPLDIEFALERDRLWILQARPVGVFRATLRETLEHYPLAGPATPPVPTSLEEVGS